MADKEWSFADDWQFADEKPGFWEGVGQGLKQAPEKMLQSVGDQLAHPWEAIKHNAAFALGGPAASAIQDLATRQQRLKQSQNPKNEGGQIVGEDLFNAALMLAGAKLGAKAAPAVSRGLEAGGGDLLAGGSQVGAGMVADAMGAPSHIGTLLGLHRGGAQMVRGIGKAVKAMRTPPEIAPPEFIPEWQKSSSGMPPLAGQAFPEPMQPPDGPPMSGTYQMTPRPPAPAPPPPRVPQWTGPSGAPVELPEGAPIPGPLPSGRLPGPAPQSPPVALQPPPPRVPAWQGMPNTGRPLQGPPLLQDAPPTAQLPSGRRPGPTWLAGGPDEWAEPAPMEPPSELAGQLQQSLAEAKAGNRPNPNAPVPSPEKAALNDQLKAQALKKSAVAEEAGRIKAGLPLAKMIRQAVDEGGLDMNLLDENQVHAAADAVGMKKPSPQQTITILRLLRMGAEQ